VLHCVEERREGDERKEEESEGKILFMSCRVLWCCILLRRGGEVRGGKERG
jgi:hypothetical protein